MPPFLTLFDGRHFILLPGQPRPRLQEPVNFIVIPSFNGNIRQMKGLYRSPELQDIQAMIARHR
jgi:hypothetical protein